MGTNTSWTNASLFEFLTNCEMAQAGNWSVQLIEGSEESILVTVVNQGDLEIYVSVAGEQILASVLLWPSQMVNDPVALNAGLLRDHKLLPLSTFGITQSLGEEWYELFGALSADSDEGGVLTELMTLEGNAIEVVEAYQDYLN
jgi:uncharacterized protein YjfI (DUF2170 family)